MALEILELGIENGYAWTVDHDNVAGTIAVTVTAASGQIPQPGNLTLHGQVFSEPSNTLVGTIAPIRIDGFLGRGRQILFTNAGLVGVVLVQPKGTAVPFALSIWTSFSAG